MAIAKRKCHRTNKNQKTKTKSCKKLVIEAALAAKKSEEVKGPEEVGGIGELALAIADLGREEKQES